MPSDELVAIRLSLSFRRKPYRECEWAICKAPVAADSSTGKYLRECRSEIRVVMKQEKGETRSEFRTVFPGGFSPRPQENKAAEQHESPARPLCLKAHD